LLEASYSSEAKRPQPPLINPQPTLGSHQPQHFRKLFRISTKDSPSFNTAKHICILIEGPKTVTRIRTEIHGQIRDASMK
jgi:hypothetical protein